METQEIHKVAVALGKFDGIHLGHQLLLKKLSELKKEGFTSAVLTFDTRIASVSRDTSANSFLLTPKEREFVLEKYGLDLLLECPFTEEFRSLSPQDFVEKILIESNFDDLLSWMSDFDCHC